MKKVLQIASLLILMLTMLVSISCAFGRENCINELDTYSFQGGITVFTEGDAFCVDGRILALSFLDGENLTVPVTTEMLLSEPNMSLIGNQTVEIQYANEVFSYTITVQAKAVLSYVFENLPQAYQGRKYDITGASLIVYYQNDTSERVSVTPEMLSDPPETNMVGETTFRLAYRGIDFDGMLVVKEDPTQIELTALRTYLSEETINPSLNVLSVEWAGTGTGYGKTFSYNDHVIKNLSFDDIPAREEHLYNEALTSLVSLPTIAENSFIIGATPYYSIDANYGAKILSSRCSSAMNEEKNFYPYLLDFVLSKETITSRLSDDMQEKLKECLQILMSSADPLSEDRKDMIKSLCAILSQPEETFIARYEQGCFDLFFKTFCVSPSTDKRSCALTSFFNGIDEWLQTGFVRESFLDISKELLFAFCDDLKGDLTREDSWLLILLLSNGFQPDIIRLLTTMEGEEIVSLFFEAMSEESPVRQDALKEDFFDGLLTILSGKETDYASAYRRLSAFITGLSDEKERCAYSAMMLLTAFYSNRFLGTNVDYNSLMSDVPIPEYFEKIDYDKLIKKVSEESRRDDFLKVEPVLVSFEKDENGELKKAIVAEQIHINCDIRLVAVHATLRVQMEIAL